MTVAEERAAPAAPRHVVAPQMVGRSRELETLTATLVAAPSLAIIEGEAGMGKSRLVAELARHEPLAGHRWLVGACRRVREPFPMGPVIEALRGLGEALQEARLSPVAGALRPLVPELQPWLPHAPEPLDDRAAERHRVFRALTEVLDALGPTVLVLEDLHWADEQTVEFLTYVMAQPPRDLSVVLSFRGEEIAPRIRAATAKVSAAVHHAHVTLQPLDPEQTGSLVASILGVDRVSTQFATYLCDRASGVPFAVEELLAMLRARGDVTHDGAHWVRRAIDELAVPAGIRDPVLERMSGLSAAARAVVDAASVLRDHSPSELLLGVCQVPREEAVRAMDEALMSGLLVEQADKIGFRHVLASQAVYASLTGPRRQYLHARSVPMLAEQRPVPLGQIAHHLKQSGQTKEWVLAAERAADQALELGNSAEAARWLEEVLRDADLDDERRGRIAAKLGRAAHETLHSSAELVDLLLNALQSDMSTSVRGELAFWASTAVQDVGGDPALKLRLLREAVDALDDRPDLRAWAMLGLGLPMCRDVPLDEHIAWVKSALSIVPELAEPGLRRYVRGKIAGILMLVGDPAWRGLAALIDNELDGTRWTRQDVLACTAIGMNACYAGHLEESQRLLKLGLDGCLSRDDRSIEVQVRALMALLDYSRGAWDGLDGRIATLVEDLVDVPIAQADVAVAAGCLALARGDVRSARQRLRDVAERLEAMTSLDLLPFAVGALARLELATGQAADVTALVDRFLATMREKNFWAPVSRALPEVVAILVESGRQVTAVDMVERFRSHLSGLDVPLAPAALERAAGVLDATDMRWARAMEHYLSAADLYERLCCPYEAAQAREQAGIAAARAGAAGADSLLQAALSIYQRLGAGWDVRRCGRLARTHGVQLSVPHRGGRKGYGELLSPREREVTQLAAVGYTNKQIAAEMFLSPNTVGKHLVGAMRKLGVRTRAAIAARLTEQDVDGG